MKSPVSQRKNSNARQPPIYLAVGRIIRPHGVRGLVQFKAYSDLIRSLAPDDTLFIGNEREEHILRIVKPHRAQFLLAFKGCESRNTAERWRDEEVFIRFDEAMPLPEGVYYHWQILDLQVFTLEGELLGKVVEILETGANDVYVVKGEDGSELLLPAIEQVIQEVDLESSRIVVNLLPGLRTGA